MPEPIICDSVTAQASTNAYVVALSAQPCGIVGEKLVFSFKNSGDESITYKFTASDGATEHTYLTDTTLASGADDIVWFRAPWKIVKMLIKSAADDTPGALTGKVLYG
jgi:hypothetical protein